MPSVHLGLRALPKFKPDTRETSPVMTKTPR
jgi:hypothetical protein